MKKFLFVFTSAIILSSCVSYQSATTPTLSSFGDYCNNASYIATYSFHEKTYTDSDGEVRKRVLDKSIFTVYQALKYARSNHGEDVTVTNFQFDTKRTVTPLSALMWLEKKEIIGMTFDVIKCQ